MKPIITTKTSPLSSVFLHIPKCGGSSVHQVFRDYDNLHVDDGGRFYEIQDITPIFYGPKIEPDFKWVFVRNPYSRLLSVFSIMNERRVEGISMDYVVYIAGKLGVPQDRRRGIESDHEIWTHTRPCSWYNFTGIDFFGKTENIISDWDYICSSIGIIEELPHVNPKPVSCNPLEVFSINNRNKIEQIYKEDFERFGYSFNDT